MNHILPSGTVTFLFTDIEGSTQLWEQFPIAMRDALARHDEILRMAIESHGGHIVKNLGDGVYAVFNRAGDAVAAAMAAQLELQATSYELHIQNAGTIADPRTADRVSNGMRDATFGRGPVTDPPAADSLIANPPPLIRVRMGIHTGEAELREGDYHGSALNRADRIMSAGHGEQILLSATTASVCEGSLPKGATLRDMGEHRLRGLARPERIYQLLLPGLPADFPPLRSLGEYVVSLPTPPTRFIGRAHEVDQIVDLLSDAGIHLISLVGPGGMGKTRLAIEVASRLAGEGGGRFLDGVYFVPLAPLSAGDSMVMAIAQTVGFRFRRSEETPRRQLLDYLRRKRILLVMDNFEHLLKEGGADLPAEILENAPDVGILATSRTRLNVQGEHLVIVSGMRAPDAYTIRRLQARAESDEEAEAAISRAATDYPAVRLFAQSAARVRPGFRLTNHNIADVARICRQVEGLPLGIELAAAWLEALTLPEIAGEIERSLDILATEQRGIPDRQRSIRAVFDTSWALLSDRERAILPMLSIFRGGFARESAEFVAAATLRDLLGLVNKSWLQPVEVRAPGDDQPTRNGRSKSDTPYSSPVPSSGRFMGHALLRQYAEQKLAEMPELAEQARDRQARYYARFLESNMRRMIGPEQARAYDAVAEEFDDISQAWDWWTRRGEYGRLVDQMLLALFLYASARFVGTEVAPLLDQAIEVLQADAGYKTRETSTASSAFVGHSTGVPDPLSTELASLLVARTAIYVNYFTREFTPGDIRAAWDIAVSLGDEAPRRLGFWYVMLNLIYGWRVERAPALANLRAFVAAPGDALEMTIATAHQVLARLLIREFAPESDLLEARHHLDTAMAIFERWGNQDAMAGAFSDQNDISTLLGRYDEALGYLDRAQPAAESVGNWGMVWITLLSRREVYLQRGQPELMFPVFEEMLAMSRRVSNFRLECWTLGWDSIYALRYHSTERALFKRQAAMLVADEFGLEYDRAWSALELGDIYRLMGDAEAARRWYGVALSRFEQQHHDMGLAFYRRGLGDLALARGDWAEAETHHRAYLDWAITGDTWSRIYALCGVGRAEMGLGRSDAALGRFREALGLAVSSARRDTESLPVACIAHLAASAGHPALAARLAEVLLASPLTWNETRQWISALTPNRREIGLEERAGLINRLHQTTGETVETWLAAAEAATA